MIKQKFDAIEVNFKVLTSFGMNKKDSLKEFLSFERYLKICHENMQT